MADPDSFKECNFVFGAGDNPNTDQLAVAICTHEGTPERHFVVSKWKLTHEEKMRVIDSGEVWVSMMGTRIMPFSVHGLQAFNDLNYKPVTIEDVKNIH